MSPSSARQSPGLAARFGAAADDLRARQRVRGGAARALDTQRASEADEIGGRADVLVGHEGGGSAARTIREHLTHGKLRTHT
jgi:hypothetical protein